MTVTQIQIFVENATKWILKNNNNRMRDFLMWCRSILLDVLLNLPQLVVMSI